MYLGAKSKYTYYTQNIPVAAQVALSKKKESNAVKPVTRGIARILPALALSVSSFIKPRKG